MKLILSIMACVLFFGGIAQARECQYEKGEARWSIKTSVPAGGAQATKVDLDSLIGLDNPDLSAEERSQIDDTRWSGDIKVRSSAGQDAVLHEGDLVTVSGYLYRARCQKDGDYHMEIGSDSARKNASCLIVEVPDPGQVQDPKLHDAVSAARAALESQDASVFASHATKAPPEVEVTGQLFLDETHAHTSDPGGGRGTLLASGKHCATNLWEIHPVSNIQ